MPSSGETTAASGLQRRLVLGTVAQQAGQAVGLVSSLALATALGRELTLSEFGVYGLVVSFSTYLFFALGSAETAAVRTIAAATDRPSLDRAVTVAAVVYAGFGLAAAILVAGLGTALLPLFHLDPSLYDEAQRGVLALAVTTGIGLPLRLFQDLLRATQRFVLAGVAEALGYSALAAAVLLCLFTFHTDLWVLIAVGGAIPMWLGLAAILLTIATPGARFRLRPRELSRERVRAFLGIFGAMTFIAASDLFINSLDRTIVGAFRNVATVGLYEGAARLNALIRALVGSLSVTLLPVLSRFSAEGSTDHERALVLRGTRYILAAVVPPTVVAMVLCDRLLAIWLGDKFTAAAAATAIFLAWWLFAANSSVANSMMVVDGELRRLAAYSWSIAGINLALSLALTPLFGLVGVAIGTTAAYLAVQPFFLRYALARRRIALSEFARTAWIPAYGASAIVALGLLVVRLTVSLDGTITVLAVAAAATLAGYALVLAVFFDAGERAMFRSFMRRA
jgi:O-antigen/teichoic acid export membrane protein